jgi:hypothetical protein
MTTKRHAKPTSAQLIARMYRKVNAWENFIPEIINRLGTIREFHYGDIIHITERLDSLSVVADHCARLLKEKETLVKQLEAAVANACKCPPKEIRHGGGPFNTWRDVEPKHLKEEWEKRAADVLNSAFDRKP